MAGTRHLADLTSLKVALGIPQEDHTDDAKYDWVLEAASEAIRKYTDRDFGPQDTEEPIALRQFEYDGSGFCDIDDCTLIHSVSLNGNALIGSQWVAQPFGGPIYNYLRLTPSYWSDSPAMGFTRNADTYGYREPVTPAVLGVEAVWGWPSIPPDVQQAAIWTAVALAESPRPYISESIEGYSRTVGTAPDFAIPPRAQAMLAPYTRIKI